MARRRRRRRRRNIWRGHPRLHRKAALKGWRKKRRRTGRRKKSRRRRKCVTRKCRSRAAKKGWRKSGRKKRTKRRTYGKALAPKKWFGMARAANPRKRRRRRGRRRNRGYRMSYNRGHYRRARNQFRLGGLASGFSLASITDAAVISAGAFANTWASGMLTSLIPVDFLKRGFGNLAVGLLSAGAIGVGSKMILPRWSGNLFTGAMVETVTRGLKQYILPMIPFGGGGTSGFGDYLTVSDAQQGIATPLGDYLTVGDAQQGIATPLGQYAYETGEEYVGEELASLGS